MSDAAREDCARPAAAAAHLAIAPAGLCIVCEGAARLAVAHDMAAQPGSSAGFYNPRMRLNRELCLSELKAALRPGPWRAQGGGGGGGEGLGAVGPPLRIFARFDTLGSGQGSTWRVK